MTVDSTSKIIADIKGLITGATRLVFVSGNFNILHPGHLRLLRFAKECGDFLVVAINEANSPGAFLPEQMRLESVQAINWVDYGFVLHGEATEFIRHLKPDIVVKGNEHEQENNPELDIISSYGGKLLFSSGDVSFSSIDLLRREWKEFNPSTIHQPSDYVSRHGIEANTITKIIHDMTSLRICVVGDVIIDEYISCDALGMSQEDPTIVVTPIHQEKFIGGAGIVALHANSFCSSVSFFTVIGNDHIADFAVQEMNQYGVVINVYRDVSRPTTLKQRYRVGQKTMLRVNHLRQHDIAADIRMSMFEDIRSTLDEIDLLIFADFNYGCLPQTLVEMIEQECIKRNIMMVADSQASSQIGDVSRYRNMALITPTEREARIAMHDFDSGLVVLAEKLKEKTAAQNVVITLGSEGVLIHSSSNQTTKWPTDRLPALNSSPKDVAGAGDSFLTVTSMALAVGANIWQASYLGSLAAACQVGRIGNIPLTKKELLLEIVN